MDQSSVVVRDGAATQRPKPPVPQALTQPSDTATINLPATFGYRLEIRNSRFIKVLRADFTPCEQCIDDQRRTVEIDGWTVTIDIPEDDSSIRDTPEIVVEHYLPGQDATSYFCAYPLSDGALILINYDSYQQTSLFQSFSPYPQLWRRFRITQVKYSDPNGPVDYQWETCDTLPKEISWCFSDGTVELQNAISGLQDPKLIDAHMELQFDIHDATWLVVTTINQDNNTGVSWDVVLYIRHTKDLPAVIHSIADYLERAGYTDFVAPIDKFVLTPQIAQKS